MSMDDDDSSSATTENDKLCSRCEPSWCECNTVNQVGLLFLFRAHKENTGSYSPMFLFKELTVMEVKDRRHLVTEAIMTYE